MEIIWQNGKGLRVGQILTPLKIGYFSPNDNGLTLLFDPNFHPLKIDNFFLQNGKGLTLLFGPNLNPFKIGNFSQNGKGLTLLFGPNLNPFKIGILLAKW